MEVRQLRHFVTVAEWESFTLAAQQLHTYCAACTEYFD